MPGEYFFARFYDPVLDPYIRKLRHKVLELAFKYKPQSVLDVCCGTGHQLKLLKKHGFQVTGIDLSDKMLNISRKGALSPNCVKGDATQMPFEDGSFDMVMITLALHENHTETARKIIREMTRVVKAEGSVIIIDYEITGKTRRDARFITKAVEWMVGGDHYRNFKVYLQQGGLDHLLEGLPLSPMETHRYAGNSMVIKVMKKQGDLL